MILFNKIKPQEANSFEILKDIKQLALLKKNNKEASPILTGKINQHEKESIENLYELKIGLDEYMIKNAIDNDVANAMNDIYRELMIARVKSLEVPSITDYIIYHTFDGNKDKQKELLKLLEKFNLLPQKAA